MIIAQLSIAPVGAGTSLGKYVRRVIDVLSREEKIRFETNAMSTVIESPDLETLFDVIQKAHRAVLEMGIKRVITEIKIDDRQDKNATIKSKMDSVMRSD